MAKPECTCDPFIFAEDTPYETKLHHQECPAFCGCRFVGALVGRRGQIIHLETCGWCEQPQSVKSGSIKGLRSDFTIYDET